MPYLLDNRLAPVTWEWGFLEAPLDQVNAAYRAWRARIEFPITEEPVCAPCEDALRRLAPLTWPFRRSLFLQTAARWTACFNNCVGGGGDVDSTLFVLCQDLRCRAVMVGARPRYRLYDHGGETQFRYYRTDDDGRIEIDRAVFLSNDTGRWTFHTSGPPQPFEQEDRYHARRVRDRLTTEMLDAYGAALGLRLFEPAFYGPQGVMVTKHSRMPPGFPCKSFDEVQQELGPLKRDRE